MRNKLENIEELIEVIAFITAPIWLLLLIFFCIKGIYDDSQRIYYQYTDTNGQVLYTNRSCYTHSFSGIMKCITDEGKTIYVQSYSKLWRD